MARRRQRRLEDPTLQTVLHLAPFSGKRSTPYGPGTVHDYMHAKFVVADDMVFVGSYNLSHSGEENAENVLEIRDPALADGWRRSPTRSGPGTRGRPRPPRTGRLATGFGSRTAAAAPGAARRPRPPPGRPPPRGKLARIPRPTPPSRRTDMQDPGQYPQAPAAPQPSAPATFPVTTTFGFPGWRIERSLGTVFGLVVRSMGFAKGFGASFRALAGGEVKQYTELLEDSRRHAMDRMIENARLLGANADRGDAVRLVGDGRDAHRDRGVRDGRGRGRRVSP